MAGVTSHTAQTAPAISTPAELSHSDRAAAGAAVVGTGGELNLLTFSVHRALRPVVSTQKGLNSKLL